MQGRFYASQTQLSSLQKAEQLFEQAVTNDPQFWLAYWALADTFLIQYDEGFLAGEVSFAKIQYALNKASVVKKSSSDKNQWYGKLLSYCQTPLLQRRH
jgi:hypothetical protein